LIGFGKIHGVPPIIKSIIVAIVIAHTVANGVLVVKMAAKARYVPFTPAECSKISRLAVAVILLVIGSMMLIYTPSSDYGLIAITPGVGGCGVLATGLWYRKPTRPDTNNKQS
jgi:hypothetical protein